VRSVKFASCWALELDVAYFVTSKIKL